MSKAIEFKGFSIEQERDGTFSVYRFGYISGGFRSINEACQDILWRLQ